MKNLKETAENTKQKQLSPALFKKFQVGSYQVLTIK